MNSNLFQEWTDILAWLRIGTRCLVHWTLQAAPRCSATTVWLLLAEVRGNSWQMTLDYSYLWCEFARAEPHINPSFFLLLLSAAFVHSWWGIRITAVTVESLLKKFCTVGTHSRLNSVMVLTVILSQSIFLQYITVSLSYFSVLSNGPFHCLWLILL